MSSLQSSLPKTFFSSAGFFASITPSSSLKAMGVISAISMNLFASFKYSQIGYKRSALAHGGFTTLFLITFCFSSIDPRKIALINAISLVGIATLIYRVKTQPLPPPREIPQAPREKQSPQTIEESLNKIVHGQTAAKKSLAVATYTHVMRFAANLDNRNIHLPKSNIFMMGPSGCGKTLLARTLHRIIKLPFVIVDANSLTSEGYAGNSVRTIIDRLYQTSNYNKKTTEFGIVYIDEIDKLRTSSSFGKSYQRDITGEGVQQALLTLLEGENFTVYHPKDKWCEKPININTQNILFIVGGAFVNLERTAIDGEENSPRSNRSSLDSDLIRYGMAKEFVGRFSCIAELESLTQDDFYNILTKGDLNSIINQNINLFMLASITLEFTDEALRAISEKAAEYNTGARALSGLINTVLEPIKYNCLSDDTISTVTITAECVTENADPTITRIKNEEAL